MKMRIVSNVKTGAAYTNYLALLNEFDTGKLGVFDDPNITKEEVLAIVARERPEFLKEWEAAFQMVQDYKEFGTKFKEFKKSVWK